MTVRAGHVNLNAVTPEGITRRVTDQVQGQLQEMLDEVVSARPSADDLSGLMATVTFSKDPQDGRSVLFILQVDERSRL